MQLVINTLEALQQYAIRPWVGNPDMHHSTCVTHMPWYMSESLTSGFLWSQWWWKRSGHSWGMSNPQFYISGKRPMTKLCTLQASQPPQAPCTWWRPVCGNVWRKRLRGCRRNSPPQQRKSRVTNGKGHRVGIRQYDSCDTGQSDNANIAAERQEPAEVLSQLDNTSNSPVYGE